MTDPRPTRRSAPAREHRHHARVAAGIGAIALLVVAVLGGVVAFTGGDSPNTAKAASGPPKTTAPEPVPSTVVTASLRAASTKGSAIPVYADPSTAAPPTVTLSPQTEYLAPRTLLAFDQRQDWLHVYLPTRPNNATGWVRTSDVTLSSPLEYAVRVSLADHKLSVLHNGNVELIADVAIGAPEYPTPTGTFYFTDPVDLHATPNTAYGVFAYGLSGHSDVLTEFGGGDGQIAIHGTNEPGSIGRDVSHGCVRVLNDVMEQISKLPLGTPVYIS